MQVLFVAGFGPIVADTEAAKSFYSDTLGIAFTRDGDYLHTGELDGVKHFALWSLADAAQDCFGSAAWPTDIPAPKAWIEFDVEDLAAATDELQAKGLRLLVAQREYPWGQTVSRLLAPDGLLVGIAVTPFLRKESDA